MALNESQDRENPPSKLSYDEPPANGMPMRRIRRRVTRSESHTLLYFAAGAVAGAAAGVLLGRRFRTRRDFFDAVRDKFGALKEYWDAAELEENDMPAFNDSSAPRGSSRGRGWRKFCKRICKRTTHSPALGIRNCNAAALPSPLDR